MSDYQASLMDLAAAVRSGMDPNTAYSIYGDMNSQHIAQMEARKARVQSLVDMVTGGAQTGTPMDTMQMVLDAQKGGSAPAVDQAMQSMYPAGSNIAQQVSGAVTNMGAAAQSFGGPSQQYAAPVTSPAYAGPTPEQQAQEVALQSAQLEQASQVQELQQQAMISQLTTDLAQDAAAYAKSKMSRDDFVKLALSDPGYQQLLAANPDAFTQIIGVAFAKEEVPTATA